MYNFFAMVDFHRQIDGVAMGSPLDAFPANAFIGKIEKTSLRETIKDLAFYGRYVDTIFCVTDYNADNDALVAEFNNAHPSLNFAAETEVDDEIAFLDVHLRRQDDNPILRGAFQKKTWTGQYTNFYSFFHLNIKRNPLQGLAARVRRICTPETVEAKLQQLQRTLIENGFLERFTLRNIGERTRSLIP
ncbi:unnamed protein product [Dibothriocephalus latus]|uniref:Helix-turn-helix domain-containing protein n=1 Tax=Dibothriocephalus latus TaxID=60516 RepID=A0A3P7LNG2_DIBLA|nr:unnamed protein product [Dibothriocephalus latus]